VPKASGLLGDIPILIGFDRCGRSIGGEEEGERCGKFGQCHFLMSK